MIQEPEHISKKKNSYPVGLPFKKYLARHGRETILPIDYTTLKHYSSSLPLHDKTGKDTLWETVFYHPSLTDEIHRSLKRIYSLLKVSGHSEAEEHLHIERIDYCIFGNSKPFRIKIVNNYNEVHDYFYVKVADASRIWGLELEHLLSPYRINYIVDNQTLIEEHISGIPGDVFIKEYLPRPEFNPRRIAKEFVKFNERCFMRLLGDMRSYNFVFDISQDFDDIQFRIRSIDFDQQGYEGRKNIYLPQFFKENNIFVEMVRQHLHPDVIMQYRMEERSVFIKRMQAEAERLGELEAALQNEVFSSPEKVKQLADELGAYHHSTAFSKCDTMARILQVHMLEFIAADLK